MGLSCFCHIQPIQLVVGANSTDKTPNGGCAFLICPDRFVAAALEALFRRYHPAVPVLSVSTYPAPDTLRALVFRHTPAVCGTGGHYGTRGVPTSCPPITTQVISATRWQSSDGPGTVCAASRGAGGEARWYRGESRSGGAEEDFAPARTALPVHAPSEGSKIAVCLN
jgi:hypothetical protein